MYQILRNKVTQSLTIASISLCVVGCTTEQISKTMIGVGGAGALGGQLSGNKGLRNVGLAVAGIGVAIYVLESHQQSYAQSKASTLQRRYNSRVKSGNDAPRYSFAQVPAPKTAENKQKSAEAAKNSGIKNPVQVVKVDNKNGKVVDSKARTIEKPKNGQMLGNAEFVAI